MEQHPGGIKLTERNEFIVIGQACSELSHVRVPDDIAASHALDHLTSLDDKEWLLPDSLISNLRPKVHTLVDQYIIWRGQLSAGLPEHMWDDDSKQIWELYHTSIRLIGMMATRLGVPDGDVKL
jgi:hypothetical protein